MADITSMLQAASAGGAAAGFTLYTWGRNTFGQLGQGTALSINSPKQIGDTSTWSDVSMAFSWALLLKSDGTLWGVGANGTGQLGDNTIISKSSPVQIGALSDWAQINAGSASYAIKTNGTLWAWGTNGNGRLGDGTTQSRSSPIQIGALSDWAQVSSGSSHTMAIKTDGTLWGWGSNTTGELGTGNTIARSSPVQIGALSDWAQVSCGNTEFTMAIKTNGTLWGWGFASLGRLGTGDTINRSSPVQIGALSNWAQVKANSQFCIAIKTDGSLWGWGINSSGQLGDNTLINKSSPIQIGNLSSDWAQIGSTYFATNTLALKTNGTLWAWGQGAGFRNAINSLADLSSPVQVGNESTWSKVSNSASGMAIKTNGTLWGWGTTANGVLGLPINEIISSPIQVGSNEWLSVSFGGSIQTSAGIKADNTLWTWGAGASGALGDNSGSTGFYNVPTKVGNSTDWAQVLVSGNVMAIKTDGTLWGIGGDGANGVFGNNSVASISSPVQIGALSDWSELYPNQNRTWHAIKTDGTLWGWGLNSGGQIGDGTVISRSSPVQIGALSDWAQVAKYSTTGCIAIKTDGTLWGWGTNSDGQLGDNTIISKSSPVQIGALSDWAQVSGGNARFYAVKTNGTLWAWGSNTSGRLGDGTVINRSSPVQIGALSDWAMVSGGSDFCIALKTNGTLWAWGNNTFGQLGQNNAVATSSPVQIGTLTNWVATLGTAANTLSTGAFSN